jgi:predicted GNAT family acetyltransferase
LTPRAKRFATLDELVAFGEARLMANEPKNSLLLGIITRLRQIGVSNEEFFFFGVEDDHGPRAVALQTPPRFLALDDADEDAARALAAIAPRGLPGVIGPIAAATAFAEAYAKTHGHSCRTTMVQGVYRLETLIPAPSHPGSARFATNADADLLRRWVYAFAEDCRLPQDERDAGVKAVPDLIERGAIALWCVDGEPVAMCGRAGTSPNIGRVSYVYTPPALRGRGHAGAIVEFLTARILSEGKRWACLTTDMANATSNGLYTRLGYEKIGEATMIAFDG